MKTPIAFFTALFLFIYSLANCTESTPGNEPPVAQSIKISASPGLYDLALHLANEYNRVNPAQVIIVKTSPDNIIDPGAALSLLNASSTAKLMEPANWNIVVGREVIVPVMNSGNPWLAEISRQGISSSSLAKIFAEGSSRQWGLMLGNADKSPIHFYKSDDQTVNAAVSNFLKVPITNPDDIAVTNSKDLVAAVQQDPYGIGFCKLADLIDKNSQFTAGNVCLVPIDKNGNGKIDFMEDIYDNLQDFSRGIWIGKYPKALSGYIFASANEKPANNATIEFLKWVLNDGQYLLNENGYCELVSGEKQTQIDKITVQTATIVAAAEPRDRFTLIRTILLILVGFALLGFILDIVSRYFGERKHQYNASIPSVSDEFSEKSVIVPKGLFYDKSHTWTFMEKEGHARIGIDDFLLHVTGLITKVNMKKPGDIIRKGELMLTLIQKGKRLSIKSPVTGVVRAQNTRLVSDPSLLNSAPYTDGWVYTVEPANWSLEMQFLTLADKYQSFLTAEFVRLKDFFNRAIQPKTSGLSGITLQDGGSFRNHILADMGPDVWEAFQDEFIEKF